VIHDLFSAVTPSTLLADALMRFLTCIS